MKKYIFIFGFLIVFAGISFAQLNEPGLSTKPDNSVEVISVSDGYKIVVPKGLGVEQKNGQIFVEDTGQFLLKRVEALELQVQNMQATLDTMSQALEAMSNRNDERYAQILQLITENQK